MELRDLQASIARTYLDRDRDRGVDGTFRWLVEEVGELARALRRGEPENLAHELGDVLAWTLSVANLAGVDLAGAAARYEVGCPKCGHSPCGCAVR